MKVIVDLMEAYSEHVGLPLLLIDLKSEIDYKVNTKNNIISKYNSTRLLDFKNTSKQLTSPTMISVLDDYYDLDVFYFITPVFKVNDSENFLAAGPFQIESINQTKSVKDNLPIIFNEEEIEERIRKMCNLHLLLVSKAQVESRFSMLEQIQKVLHTLEKFDSNLLKNNHHMFSILDELEKIDAFDFLGYAKRNEEEVFEIEHIAGDQLEELIGKSFYIGEGLLGKAVILGKDFYWSKGIDTQRAEFLNKYGIFPKHLFGFIINVGENVESIVFGGSFKNEMISENLLKIVKCVVHLVSQRKNISAQIIDSFHIHSIFANWLDLMDIANDVKDRKLLSYKILDFCQTLNNGLFSCFSTVNGEFFYRGKLQQDVIDLHKKALTHKFNRYHKRIWIEQNCIHFYLDFNAERYTLFTVEFKENTDIQQVVYILGMLEKLIIEDQKNKEVSSNKVMSKCDSIFQLLYTSMSEMNQSQYQRSHLAISISNKLVEQLNLSFNSKKRLENICKVLPYTYTYLEKEISHTEEWELFKGTQSILKKNENYEAFSTEIKIIAFIYKVVIHQDQNANLDFLSEEFKDLCMNTYKSAIKLTEQHIELPKVELNHQKIDEITDIHSVISTLALTSREKEILYLIIEGLNNQEVGQYLTISVHTVKNHVTNIFKKLNVSDRFQAMAKIYRIKYGDV